ncbi:MATE family efflux transporter [Salinisphaera sp.]|uniref:MATE family efflux transporter n=1 Tax=Salinisphaera sp. TaxID=1914330 RepID=UPI000C55822C|nr:MATE family efflux transporter [Salinisphaera sp.]MAS09245.1 MATE family efflux transporter [Salinisphaera sp.]
MARAIPNLTQGSIVRALITLAVPIVFANLLQTAYQLIDTFWVGRLGAGAVAAVSLSFPVIFFLISLGLGLAVAGTILVAQYQGRRDTAMVNRVSAQALIGVVAISLVLAVLGFIGARVVVAFLGAADEVLPMATRYLRVSFVGLPFLFAYVIFQSLMRGVGDARTPLLIVTGTVALNFVLDPLFILGWGPMPGLGVSGAALATVITQGLAAVVGLAMLFSGRYGIRLERAHLTPDFALIWRLLKLGLPAAIEQSTRALGLMLMTILVAGFGTVALAAYGIGTRMLSFVIIPALGLSQATSALIGQNIGAARIDRAERTAWLSAAIALVALSGVGVLAFLFAEALVTLFVPGAPGVIAAGALFVRITALTYGVIGAQIVITGAFRGSGNTLVAMAIALVSLWVLQFPLAWLLSERAGLGETGIWIAYPVQNVITCLIAALWFARGSWKQRRVIEAEPPERAAAEYRPGNVTNTTLR